MWGNGVVTNVDDDLDYMGITEQLKDYKLTMICISLAGKVTILTEDYTAPAQIGGDIIEFGVTWEKILEPAALATALDKLLCSMPKLLGIDVRRFTDSDGSSCEKMVSFYVSKEEVVVDDTTTGDDTTGDDTTGDDTTGDDTTGDDTTGDDTTGDDTTGDDTTSDDTTTTGDGRLL